MGKKSKKDSPKKRNPKNAGRPQTGKKWEHEGRRKYKLAREEHLAKYSEANVMSGGELEIDEDAQKAWYKENGFPPGVEEFIEKERLAQKRKYKKVGRDRAGKVNEENERRLQEAKAREAEDAAAADDSRSVSFQTFQAPARSARNTRNPGWAAGLDTPASVAK